MGTKMQQRRGSAADWSNANPTLDEGEIGFETDTKVVKVGDGVTAWNNLNPPFLGKDEVAYDSERLGGLESGDFLKVSAADSFARDRGTGTTWPASGNRRGDTYFHEAVSQIGVWTGTGWRLVAPGRVASLAARNDISWGYPGLEIYVNADGRKYEYQNSVVGWTLPWGQPWGSIHDAEFAASSQVLTNSFAKIASNPLQAIPANRHLEITVSAQYYSSSTSAGTIRFRQSVYRTVGITAATDGYDKDLRMAGGYGDIRDVYLQQTFYTAGPITTQYEFVVWAVHAGGLAQPVYRIGDALSSRFTVKDLGPVGPPPAA